MALHSDTLPVFPWDTLDSVRNCAARYPGGAIDLTIGSPVDPAPQIAVDALTEAANAHSYPANAGSREWRTAVGNWLKKRRAVQASVDYLPALGEKELVAMLPSLLGYGRGSVVAFPEVAYPTYEVGARLSGATPYPLNTESDPAQWPSNIDMLWLNSPSNPTGHVLSASQLRAIVQWGRRNNVLIVSDECYAELVWDAGAEAPSIVDTRVCGEDASGILMLYSLSKQSNAAGYRAAFIAGDKSLIAQIREIRKHAGMMMPSPIQHVMARLLGDSEHVRQQYHVYAHRREVLLAALPAAGLCNDPHDVAGLYLWVRASDAVFPSPTAMPSLLEETPAWDLVQRLSRIGIIAAPGTFYGSTPECCTHVRISLTATDRDIEMAAQRLLAEHF